MPRPSFRFRFRSLLASLLAAGLSVGCTSLSYDQPDAPPKAPRGATASAASAASAARADDWSRLAAAARTSLRLGQLDEAERDYLASLAATQRFGDRDVRRQTALGNPARLVEAYQSVGRLDAADRLTDSVLAEAQGAKPFPLDAWTLALQTQLDLDREAGGREAELERARRIAEIHLGPLQDATEGEVLLRRRVGKLLAEDGDAPGARAQLGWAARAGQPMLRLPIQSRLELLFEAADASSEAGDPTSAEHMLQAAVELARGGGDAFETALAANRLGWFWVEQGRSEAAVPLLEEARDALEEAGAPPAALAAVLDSLAVALHRAGRLDESDAAFAQAISARDLATPEEQAALAAIDAHWAELRSAREAQPSAANTNDS